MFRTICAAEALHHVEMSELNTISVVGSISGSFIARLSSDTVGLLTSGTQQRLSVAIPTALLNWMGPPWHLCITRGCRMGGAHALLNPDEAASKRRIAR
jgi:hypothetical protein